MSHSNTPPVKKRAPLTTRSSTLRCVSAAEHHTAEHYSITCRINHKKKTSPNKRPIMEYFPRLPQDTKPLRSCSGNRAKIDASKSHLGIKCYSQYIKVIRMLQPVLKIVNGATWDALCVDWRFIVLVLLAINFILQISHLSKFHSASVTLTPALWHNR